MLRQTLTPERFIEKLTRESSSEDCLRCNGQPFCSLFLGVAYLELDVLTKARLQVEEALLGFGLRGMRWNQAMGHWLLGLILLQEGAVDPSLRSLQKALILLRELLEELRSESNYRQAGQCQEFIDAIGQTLAKISSLSSKEATPSDDFLPKTEAASVTPPEPLSEEAGYVAIPWVPIYRGVRVAAGSGEWRWVEEDIKQKGELSEVFIGNTRYTIHPVQSSGKRVTLTTRKQYGWVKVQGHSMNAASPTPIQENDYVLFYQSGWPEQDEIVIVSQSDSTGAPASLSYRVKQYSRSERLLQSRTTLHGAEYEPVDIMDDHRCLGVVIAVAKPQI
jgi:hypothetical protein